MKHEEAWEAVLADAAGRKRPPLHIIVCFMDNSLLNFITYAFIVV